MDHRDNVSTCLYIQWNSPKPYGNQRKQVEQKASCKYKVMFLHCIYDINGWISVKHYLFCWSC